MYEEKLKLFKRPKNEITVVDLFCGGGIGAYGIKRAGFNIIYAIDNNKEAVSTYNKNIGNHCHNVDIRKLDIDTIPDSDVIIGSPVCKSFSFAGNNKGFSDKQYGDLTFYYLKIIKAKKPKVLVFENVKGMVSKNHLPYFELFVKELEDIGYNIKYKVINTYKIGVPQLRERLILVGVRKDIKKEFNFPVDINNSERLSIFNAIGDLPQPTMVMNSKKDIKYISYNLKPNHIGYGVRNDELPYIDKIPQGGNFRDLDEEDAKAFMGKAFYSGGGRTGFLRKVDINKPCFTITSTMNGKNNAQILDSKELYNQHIYYEGDYSSMYLSRNRQKQWGEPSYTIVSEAKQLPLYPEPSNYDIRNKDKYDIAPPRRFTVRECLRLQSVLDDYIIDDNISLPKQYAIVGNGIPSLLTYKIFIEIENILL